MSEEKKNHPTDTEKPDVPKEHQVDSSESRITSDAHAALARMLDEIHSSAPKSKDISDKNDDSAKDKSDPSNKSDKQNDATKPLTPEQVKEESKKLEDLANKFLSGTDEKATFQAWNDELVKLAQHGMGSVKDVFEQIQNDNSGINPLKDSVDVAALKDGSFQISIFPSTMWGVLTTNYRDIGAIISKDSVFASADAGRTLAHTHLTKYQEINQQETSQSHAYLDFGASPYPHSR